MFLSLMINMLTKQKHTRCHAKPGHFKRYSVVAAAPTLKIKIMNKKLDYSHSDFENL